MAISVFDLFKIGIGPSSSHTVGPMRAARQFAQRLQRDGVLGQVARLRAELFGSLGATGKGHGSDVAVLLGLLGHAPDQIDPDHVPGLIEQIRAQRRLSLLGLQPLPFDEASDLILHKRKSLPYHPNGMIFYALAADGAVLAQRAFYSVGGGFVVDEAAVAAGFSPPGATSLRHAFKSAAELLALCQQYGLSISEIMLQNELAWRDEAAVHTQLLEIWRVMQACVVRGCERDGILPGGMKVRRRAPDLYRQLLARPEAALSDPLTVLDWVNLYALAVNEENAAGGRVVTAPTNGAAGIIPAVMHYYARFVPGANEAGIVRFMLTAGAIGILFKLNASISGAEVGCQGEVGSACSMAAGALTEVMGGTPQQVENAAEIAMEHNLGLTCDPVGGLVQVPCIERNAMAAIKAINAARMALRGDGSHFVSLDRVIKTMRDTGRDMHSKYKETARGGLAINVVEVPVNIVEC
ncbi:L-serine ammonia-lyase [Silvimonas sp. JCM 19000]